MEYLKIDKRKDVLRFGFKDINGNPITNNKGEEYYWEFDLGDIELPLKWNMIEHDHMKNQEWLRNQYILIEKKQDIQGKGVMKTQTEEKIKALNEFYKMEVKNLNKFLGEGGVETFLKVQGAKNPYWQMYQDIDVLIGEILPNFENVFENIEGQIKSKYSDKEENILE